MVGESISPIDVPCYLSHVHFGITIPNRRWKLLGDESLVTTKSERGILVEGMPRSWTKGELSSLYTRG